MNHSANISFALSLYYFANILGCILYTNNFGLHIICFSLSWKWGESLSDADFQRPRYKYYRRCRCCNCWFYCCPVTWREGRNCRIVGCNMCICMYQGVLPYKSQFIFHFYFIVTIITITITFTCAIINIITVIVQIIS